MAQTNDFKQIVKDWLEEHDLSRAQLAEFCPFSKATLDTYLAPSGDMTEYSKKAIKRAMQKLALRTRRKTSKDVHPPKGMDRKPVIVGPQPKKETKKAYSVETITYRIHDTSKQGIAEALADILTKVDDVEYNIKVRIGDNTIEISQQ